MKDKKEEKDKNKQFFLTNEEKGFLTPRIIEMQKNNMVNEAISVVCDAFVKRSILPRLGITGDEANKYQADVDPIAGIINLIPVTLQPTQTDSGIIIPSVVPPSELKKSVN